MSESWVQGAAAAALVGLALVARMLGGQWLYPPVAFSGIWAMSLVAGLLLPFGDLRLGAGAILAFVAGACAFVVGGVGCTIAVERLSGPPPAGRAFDARDPRVGNAVRLALVASSVVILALVPRFIESIRAASAFLSIDNLAIGARTVFSDYASLVPHAYASAASVGVTFAFLFAAVYDGSLRDRLLLVAAIGAPLAMLIFTFSRSPVYTLVVGVLGVMAARRRVPLAAAGVGLAIAAAGAIAMGAALAKGPDVAGSGSRVEAIARSIGMYIVGGPLGFSEVMDRPAAVGEPGLSLRIVTQALHSLGMNITLPNNVLEYARAELGNVYSFYFAYWLDFGWAGVIGAGLAAGVVATTVYELARRGSLYCLAALGIVYPALLNSPTGDGLFGSSIPYLLLGAIVVGMHVVARVPDVLRLLGTHPRIRRLGHVR